MKVPLNAISIILTLTLTALFGMFLGGLFGWFAGWLVPGIFVADHMGWDSNQQRWAAVVFCAGGGVLCGGALGAFAVAVQALMEWRRGS